MYNVGGNNMHRPILHISMLFIVVRIIRQHAELTVMTVHVCMHMT